MTIANIPIDQLTEADLRQLIEVGVPEGIAIEYKSKFYGGSVADKKEALKDISSFANTNGGDLLIGVLEENGIPEKLEGVPSKELDDEIQRLQNLARDGIEPRIFGLQLQRIGLENGAEVLCVRIPKSWNPPHRVSAKGSNRFFVRNSNGVHEASVEELRAMFTFAASTQERVEDFRRERVDRIRTKRQQLGLSGNGILVLHVMPLSAFGTTQQVDLGAVYKKHEKLRLMASMGMTPSFNLDGFVNYGGGDKGRTYTQVFRNGCLESVRSGFLIHWLDKYWVLHAGQLGDEIFAVLPGYLSAMEEVQLVPPFVVTLSLLNVSGAKLGLDGMENQMQRIPPFPDPDVLLPVVTIDRFGSTEDYQKVVRPMFDVLWNSAGHSHSTYFSDEGVWVGSKHR